MNNMRIARILIISIFLSVGLIVAPPFNQIVSAAAPITIETWESYNIGVSSGTGTYFHWYRTLGDDFEIALHDNYNGGIKTLYMTGNSDKGWCNFSGQSSFSYIHSITMYFQLDIGAVGDELKIQFYNQTSDNSIYLKFKNVAGNHFLYYVDAVGADVQIGEIFTGGLHNWKLVITHMPSLGGNMMNYSLYNYTTGALYMGKNGSLAYTHDWQTLDMISFYDATNFLDAFYLDDIVLNTTFSGWGGSTPAGYLGVNCYNESTGTNITKFNVLAVNQQGDIWYDYNVDNTYIVSGTVLPQGECTITISKTGYYPRSYIVEIQGGYFIVEGVTYNSLTLNAYLPNITLSNLYYIQIIDEALYPIEDARVVIKGTVAGNTTYANLSDTYTDGYGYTMAYLCFGKQYQVYIYKTGYDNKTESWIPDASKYGIEYPKVFKLSTTFIPQPPVIDPEEIIWTCTLLNNNSLRVIYHDKSNYSLYSFMNVTTYNSTIGWNTVGNYYYNSANQYWIRYIPNLNRSRDYVINLTYNNLYLGIQHRAFVLYQNISKPTNESETNTVFDWVGTITFGASNFFMWMFLIASMYYCDERDAGIMLIIIGVIFLIIDAYLGFSNIIMTFMGGVVPFLFIVIGILLEWGESKRRSM